MKSSIIKRFFSISPERQAADKLYTSIVAQSRNPIFYTTGQVEDTVDGRFDLLVLNAILVLRRLKGQNDYAGKVSQALFDAMFDNMDEGLREIAPLYAVRGNIDRAGWADALPATELFENVDVLMVAP